MSDPTLLALAPVKFTARILRGQLTGSAASPAQRPDEPRWWRCEEPGWWSVQTVRVGGDSVRMLIEVVDQGQCGVTTIEDWKPQPLVHPYSTQDRSFGHVLPSGGPVEVLAHERPPFGRWKAV